ncbi:hypothetical protein DPMN_115253 [Dreissena polymorpha]|uniref:Uncharacterized protein n=1 Tax=Dreissena polymorpha TaxID=45954 RepID=A0A9D4KLK9_DREPO|nr:hypothetical protein DPMN_115253 [Dreissena polymorpha]
MDVINLKDAHKVKECDKSVKNKFNFKWLEKEIDVTIGGDTRKVSLGGDFVKLNCAGIAMCKLCHKQINYGSRGCVALEDHIKSSKHMDILKQRYSNYR